MQDHEMDTGILARRAQQGDVDAFTQLVRNYQAMAFGYAVSRVGDFDVAEDAAQQAFITAYRSLDKLREPNRFGGWLRSIVYYECMHILRGRSRTDMPLDDAPDVVDSSTPHERVEGDEEFGCVFDAIRALPLAEREATILYYLHDHSQRDVASFLDIPVTTVNNRLRTSRKFLRKELLAMTEDILKENRLPDEFATRIGNIVRSEGPFIEARFDEASRPRVLNALTVTGDNSEPVMTIEAIQILDDGLVRCVPVTRETAALDSGMRVLDTGGPIRVPLQPDDVRRVMASIGPEADAHAFLETGIKVLDLSVPLPKRGTIALAGDMHSGKMVLVDELIHRLDGTDAALTIYVFVQTPEEAAAINALEYRSSRNVAAVYLPVTDARPEALGDLITGLDAVITFSKALGAAGHWPAVEPTASRSQLLDDALVSSEHRQVASQIRQTLSGDDTDAIQRLREFLAQPFFVAEPYTKQPGTTVPLEDAIRECKAILEQY